MKKIPVIFTDLDGTLLDKSYSFKEALPALRIIREKGIPLILCTSKTRAEIELWRRRIGNEYPFVSENGGGIFIPKRYSEFRIQSTEHRAQNREHRTQSTEHRIQMVEFETEDSRIKIIKEKDYFIIRLGTSYDELRKAIRKLRAEGFDVKGFGDMSAKEISKLTGLRLTDARLARMREFDEPFIFKGDNSRIPVLKRRIKAMGLNYTRGEMFHIMGDSNKGRAVEMLKTLYFKVNKNIATIALGDSPNDIEMLRSVDFPVVVRKADGSCDRRIRMRGLIRADGSGPVGWNRAVIELLKYLDVI